MAQTVFILIDSSIPSVSLGILENGTTFTYSSVSTGEGIQFSPYTIELGAGGLMAFNVPKEGKSAVFSFDEITTFSINGVDQIDPGTPIATDLQDVIDLCLPFFVEAGQGGTPEIFDLEISALDTALDFTNVPDDATVVRVSLALGQNPASPTTVNLSKVDGMSEGKEYHVYPVPGLSLALGQTLRVAVAAANVFVKSGVGSVTLSGNNAGFAHLRRSKIYNTAEWDVTLIELSVAGVS